MTEVVDADLVRDLAKQLVETVAPEEAAMFPILAQAYLSDPKRALSNNKDRDEALGFGVLEAMTPATPWAMLVAGAAIKYLTERAVGGALGLGRQAVVGGVRRLVGLGRESGSDGPAALDREQLVEVRRVAVDTARQAGLSARKAETLADALVGRMAVAQRRQGG